MARLIRCQRYLRNTAAARRDNEMVCWLRRCPEEREALRGFLFEHARERDRLLARLTVPNRAFVEAAYQGFAPGAFRGHAGGSHPCYLDATA